MDDDDNGVEYLLLGFLQQNFLEGRFGWYRQLSGGNYFCAVVQFLQAEKTIRLRNLVNLGMNMKEINVLFTPAREKASLMTKARGSVFSKSLHEFSFLEPKSDVGIVYYVSGFISTQLIKSMSCDSCKNMFSESQEHLPLDTDEAMASSDVIAEGKSFIDAISRGGLVKPSNLLFVTCMYATDLIRYIRKNPSKLSYLFESGDSRAVFIEAFLCKLKESNDTSPIIKARKKG